MSETETKETSENTLENFLNVVFNETVVTIILWFLAIYLLVSAGLKLMKQGENTSVVVKMVDFVVLLTVVMYILYLYYDLSTSERKEAITVLLQETKEWLNNGTSILVVAAFVAVLYGISYLLGKSNDMPANISFLATIAQILIVVLIVIAFFNYILGLRIIDMLWESIGALFTSEEEEEEVNDDAKPEVFNVFNNLYTYEEAPFVCQALGGRLASYDEIENSYNNGAEWCNYGWSQNQLALFPTQKNTWKKIQNSVSDCDESDSLRNVCGRPGINGGFFANPNLKFGVNCYGIKPKAKQRELDMMEANKNKVLPRSKNQIAAERKIDFWKENADKLLSINAHSSDSWSRY
jgi:hypothetical protein